VELFDAARQRADFYAPAFSVKIGGRDLVRDLAIGVSQVEVDLTLGAAGRFSFTVVDAFDIEKRAFVSGYGQPVLDTLQFGAEVEIGLGYGDLARLDRMMQGVITEITTSFDEGGAPELAVAGYDKLFPLTLGKRSQSWKDSTDSKVIGVIAQQHNLSAQIESTQDQHAQIEQNQESDVEFIKKLAERNHFEFYVAPDGVFHFGPPNDRKDGLLTLKWGEGLLSFKPEANLAAQVASVEVYGWDRDNKKAIVGKATAGEESGHDASRQSGGEKLKKIAANSVLQLRQPVFTEAEAKRRAEAVLNDHAKRFVTGEAETIGLPDILPDTNVVIGNLGQPFSKTYYVQQTTHKLDGSGYRTRFKVKETTL
jgi:phage protein D